METSFVLECETRNVNACDKIENQPLSSANVAKLVAMFALKLNTHKRKNRKQMFSKTGKKKRKEQINGDKRRTNKAD